MNENACNYLIFLGVNLKKGVSVQALTTILKLMTLGLCLLFPSFLLLKEYMFGQQQYLCIIGQPILLCVLVYYLSFRITRRRILKLISPPIRVGTKLISQDGFRWNRITLSNGQSYFENICYCSIHNIPYLNEDDECFCPVENCKQRKLSYEDMKLFHRVASSIVLKKHIATN